MAEHTLRKRRKLVYLSVAAVITAIRVSVLFYVSHRMASHTVTAGVVSLTRLLLPEGLLVEHLPFTVFEIKALYYVIFSLCLAVGSLVISIPAPFLIRPTQKI